MTEHRTEDVDATSDIHSFVVRIWVEEVETEAHRRDWHGHITDVRSGERRYIKRLDEIPEFIRSLLPMLGED